MLSTRALLMLEQGIMKGFNDAGFKTQVQPLAHFHEDYGLAADEDEGEEGEDDEEMEDADEGSEDSEDDD